MLPSSLSQVQLVSLPALFFHKTFFHGHISLYQQSPIVLFHCKVVAAVAYDFSWVASLLTWDMGLIDGKPLKKRQEPPLSAWNLGRNSRRWCKKCYFSAAHTQRTLQANFQKAKHIRFRIFHFLVMFCLQNLVSSQTNRNVMFKKKMTASKLH